VTTPLSLPDRIVARLMAVIGPPLSGTSLIGRVTRPPHPGIPSEGAAHSARAGSARILAETTEHHVRRLARFARAPRRLGLPAVPGWRDTCLSRAYAATLALRARGIPAVLSIGVRGERTAAGAVSAHAWVTLDGESLLDPTAGDFTPLSGGRTVAGVSFEP